MAGNMMSQKETKDGIFFPRLQFLCSRLSPCQRKLTNEKDYNSDIRRLQKCMDPQRGYRLGYAGAGNIETTKWLEDQGHKAYAV